MNSAPPEPGQLIETRRRQWVVTDVRSSGVARTNARTHQHLPTRASCAGQAAVPPGSFGDDQDDLRMETIRDGKANAL